MDVADRWSPKELARFLLSRPAARYTLRRLTTSPRVPDAFRDLLVVKLAKRVRFADGETFVYRHRGKALRLLHDSSSTDLYWRGEYEPGSADLFSLLCARASVVFDVGAFGGLYSIFAAAARPDARIFTFEPNASSAGICRRNLELNLPLTRNVELIELALGDRPGKASLYLTGGTSSLNRDFRAEAPDVSVDVARGDDVVREREIDRLDVVKIDTESTEPAVLRGLSATLGRDHPDVLCEVLAGRTEAALEAILEPLGYSYYWITTAGLSLGRRIVGDPTYRFPNYLFTVREADELAALGLLVCRRS